MRCRDLVELLIDYVSGELSAEHAALVQEHLEKCPPCVAYLESYRSTIRLTRRLPCTSLPPQLEQRLKAALASIRLNQMPPQKPGDGRGAAWA